MQTSPSHVRATTSFPHWYMEGGIWLVSHVGSTRSQTEIQQTIRNFTAAQWARLRRASQYYAFGRPITAKDLLQEACLRAITTRKCPDDVDVVTFLTQTMRSIASGEEDKAARRPPIAEAPESEDQEDPLHNFPHPAKSPEDEVIGREREAAILQKLLALFEDDPVAWNIFKGDMDGYSAAELRELLDLDETTYDSKRKLIRRRLNKALAEGWKP